MATSTAASVPADLERDVGLEVGGHVLRRGHELRAHLRSRVAPVCERLDRQHHPGAGGARDRHDQQPDRAAADDGDARAEPQVPEVERVDGDAERLEHRAGHAVERVGQRVQRRGRPRQVPRSPPSRSPCPAKTTFGHRLR